MTDTDRPEALDEGPRARLNLALWLVALLCAAAVIVMAALMWNTHSADGGSFLTRIGHTVVDTRSEPDADFGKDVGKGVVTALPASDSSDQQRIADVLDVATKMANAFINLDWRHADSEVAEVRSMSTGGFLKQYDKSTKSLGILSTRVHSVQKGDVVWAGYVDGDTKQAETLLAVNGTVTSKMTKGQPMIRNYRLRIDLQNVNGRWLVDNLEFVS
ncbi:MAG: hypothetical protein FWE71_15505 [Nocardioidaceae bacterium]|nr:hypothetical protein [Nocardioidaceae bacterium]MCL2611773.1 hypothetical protein [Nocardioidaceae bacterium]